jgi:hypothetical protein
MEILLTRLLRSLLLVAVTSPALASAGWVERSGAALTETPYRKASGDLSAWLVFVPDDQELYNSWQIPGETVNVSEIGSVKVNSPMSAFVIFSGCKADSMGMCDVSMRIRVTAPDGSIYAEIPEMEIWQGRQAPPPKILELSVGYLKLLVEPHEQAGTYTVQLQVKDAIAGEVIDLQKSFVATVGGV